jgi:hypothetical protein
MRAPFTLDQFLEVFSRFNQAIWPVQIGAYLLGIGALALALRGGTLAERAVPALLAGAWAFVGAGYHLACFSSLNGAAWVFGALFLLQSALFAEAALRRRLAFGFAPSLRAALGLALVAYAAIAYPIIGALLGHGYPRSPMFGVAPCPTTIFTFGILFLARGPVPARLVAIPFLWSLLGVSAALQLGIREDLGLFAAGLMGLGLLRWGRPSPSPAAR